MADSSRYDFMYSTLALLALVLTSTAPEAPALPPEAPAVALSELVEHPIRHLGRTVRVVFQFDQLSGHVDAGPFSRLDSRRDTGFRAWSDDRFLWDSEAHANPASRLTVRVGSSDAAGLRRARRYDRYEAVAVVREVSGGVPWIAITDVRRLQAFVGEGALIHAVRGQGLMDTRRYVLAAEQFERATAGTLPEPARAELLRLRDRCRARHDLARAAGRYRRGEVAIGSQTAVRRR